MLSYSPPEQKFFFHEDLKLSYTVEGDGEPILLIHGFASSLYINWYSSGWVEFLRQYGYKVITIDNRGHGKSAKPHSGDAYTPKKMADDAAALLDFLKIERAHVMGYSMGARIAAFLTLHHPAMVHSLVLGGMADGLLTGGQAWEPVASALRERDIHNITHPRGLLFRKFAEQGNNDLQALALCIQASKQLLSPEQISQLRQPVLVAVGEKDDIAGPVAPLQKLLPNGEVYIIPNRNHMLAVGDKNYKAATLNFLQQHPIPA